MVFDELKGSERLLVQAPLVPVQGTRFQSTGFPEIGPALYQAADGRNMLLMESNQSMANRLEAVCWDEAAGDLVKCLRGLPYIQVLGVDKKPLTNSILEAHRINSPYILEGKDKNFMKLIAGELTPSKDGSKLGRVDLRKLSRLLLKYDANALIHGAFLAKEEIAGGRMRLPRALSAFIEVSDVSIATSGGVKRDDVNPSGEAKKGFGHVPFVREEFTGNIQAYFNLDLAQIRGYGLGKDAEDLLIALSIYKITRFLKDGLKLRTACDLECRDGPKATRPMGYVLPSLQQMEDLLPKLIDGCKKSFSEPNPYVVMYEGG